MNDNCLHLMLSILRDFTVRVQNRRPVLDTLGLYNNIPNFSPEALELYILVCLSRRVRRRPLSVRPVVVCPLSVRSVVSCRPSVRPSRSSSLCRRPSSCRSAPVRPVVRATVVRPLSHRPRPSRRRRPSSVVP